MMKRKAATLMSSLLATALLLTACGGGATTSGDSPPASAVDAASQVRGEDDSSADKLTIWIAGGGDDITGKAYDEIFAAYREETGIEVESTFIAWSDYFTKLNTGLIGGAGPDAFMSGYGQFGTLLANDDLLALDDYIPAAWDGYDDIHENILAACVKDGVRYGVFMPNTRAFIYRKDIAEENGVTQADLTISSMDDFVDLVRKMTVYDDSGNVDIYGLEIDPDGEQHYYVYASMLQGDVQFWDSAFAPTFSTPQGVQAWQTLVELYEEGIACLRDASSTSTAVQQGTAAITLDPETAYSGANDAFPGQIGVIKNDMNTLLIGDYFAVNSATPNKEEAAALILHMVSADSMQTQMEIRNAYPGRKSLDAAYSAINPDFENVVHAFERSSTFADVPFHSFNAAITPLRSHLESAFHGVAVQDALDAATDEWNAVLEG